MNKGQLVEAVAARVGSDVASARRHVDAVFEAIMAGVADGDRITVTGFGTFDRLSRPARKARNPRTGQVIDVAAAEVPRFRVGQTFKDRVAGGVAVMEAVAAPEAVAPVEPVERVDKPVKASKKNGKKDKPSAKKSAKSAKAEKSSKGKSKGKKSKTR